MRNVLVRLVAIQVFFCLALIIALYIELGPTIAWAASYGGGVGIATSILLAWRMSQAAKPGAGLKSLYIGALERMVFALAAFGLGIAWLGLPPVGVIAGFAASQVAYYVGAGPLRHYVLSTEGSTPNGE